MSKLIDLEGQALIEAMTLSEIVVVHAASRIHNRVFGINSIAGRIDPPKLSDTTIYAAVHNLHKGGVLSIINKPAADEASGRKQKDIVLDITMTPKGRSICPLVKEVMDAQQFAELGRQPSLL